VSILAHDLGAAGVVVGQGYRFGHRAAGDTAALEALGSAAGLTVAVLPLVVARGGSADLTISTTTISSSAVRGALTAGDTAAVAGLLGRRHRVVAAVDRRGLPPASAAGPATGPAAPLLLPSASLLNEAPGVGVYAGVGVSVGGAAVGEGTVEVLPGGRGLVVVLGAGGGGWPAASPGAATLVALDF
jgi:riboflavin kinase/FMN adenylyltransferase